MKITKIIKSYKKDNKKSHKSRSKKYKTKKNKKNIINLSHKLRGGTRTNNSGVLQESLFKNTVSNTEGLDIIRSKYSSELPLIVQQIENMVTNSDAVSAFKYEYNVPPTPDFERIFTSPYEWYVEKNEDFKKLSDTPGLKVPEFRCIITSMAKDLLLIQFLNKVPKPKISKLQNLEIVDNLSNSQYTERVTEIRSKGYELLKKLEALIRDGYIYQEFLRCLHDYVGFFSYDINNSPKIKDQCKYSMSSLLEFADKHIIIVPTFFQINYEKVINTMVAPIINFRLSNRRKKIHGNPLI
jgi:hypothetical protein